MSVSMQRGFDVSEWLIHNTALSDDDARLGFEEKLRHAPKMGFGEKRAIQNAIHAALRHNDWPYTIRRAARFLNLAPPTLEEWIAAARFDSVKESLGELLRQKRAMEDASVIHDYEDHTRFGRMGIAADTRSFITAL